MSREDIKRRLIESRVIAVLRAPDPETAWELVHAYVSAGVTAIELTTSIPGWDGLLARASKELGGLAYIGLGTVTATEDAMRAIDAGAEFIVSPFVAPGVIKAAKKRDISVIPGALTPTEIAHAYDLGADMVKVFPVSLVGGPKYLKALLAPMPNWELVPTGGVTPENAIDYLKAGAVAVGMGSNLAPRDRMQARDWDGVASAVRDFLETLRGALREELP